MKYPEDHTDAPPPRIRFPANSVKHTTPSGCLLHANSRAAWPPAVEAPLDCDPAKSGQHGQFVSRRDIGLDETDKLLRRGVMAISLLSVVATVHFLLCSE